MPLLSDHTPGIPEQEPERLAWTVTLDDGAQTTMYASPGNWNHLDVNVLGTDEIDGFQLHAQAEYQAPEKRHGRSRYAFFVRLCSPDNAGLLINMDVRGPFTNRVEATGELYAWLSELLPGAEIEPIDESE